MAYKQEYGREPMIKTGRGIPKSMCSPTMQRDKQIRDVAKNISTVHNSGGNVNAYTSPGYKIKRKNKNYLSKLTTGLTEGVAYDAKELSDAALLNYRDGLVQSRDSISEGQVFDILKKKGVFNSNAYTADPNQNYDKRNDRFDKSPLEQRRDAISGKKLTGKEKFGKTKTSTDGEGTTTYTTPYSTPGTPGGKFMGKDYVPSEKERIAANIRKAKLGNKGTVETKIFTPKLAGIKPLAISFDTELSKVPLSRKKGDEPFEPIHGQSGLKTFKRGLKKPKGFFTGGNQRDTWSGSGCLI